MPPSEPSLAILSPESLAVLIDGDARQQRQLARLLLEHLDKAVYHALRDKSARDARKQDIVADLLVYLYRRDAKVLRDWDPKRAGLRGYLDMVAGRFARRQLIGRPGTAALAEEQLGPPYLPGADLETELEYRDGLAQVEAFLDQHGSPKDHARFHARFVQGRSPAEVAEDEGTSVEALHTWASRLKKRVQHALPELFELFEVSPEGRVRRRRGPKKQ